MKSDILDLNIELEKNIDFLKLIINTIPDPIFVKDSNGKYLECNQAFCDFLGFEKKDIIGKTAYDIAPLELADIYHKADLDLLNSKGVQRYETEVVFNDGSNHMVMFNKSVYLDKKDNPIGMAGVMLDITTLKNTEERLNNLLNIKDNLLNLSHSIIQVNDIEDIFFNILSTAKNAIPLTDCASILLLDGDYLSVASSIGFLETDYSNFKIKKEDSFAWKYTNGKLDKAVVVNDSNYLNAIDLIQSDTKKDILSIISAPIFVDSEFFGFINVDSCTKDAYNELNASVLEYLSNQISLVIKNHKLYEQGIYLSKYDGLTGLYLRSFFESLLDYTIAESNRYSKTFFIVLFDINNLKKINDTYGHLSGDEYINLFVKSLKENVRSSDVLARIGGDEFVGLFHQSNKLDLFNKFSSLNEYLRLNPIDFDGVSNICSFSFGIAEYPNDGLKYNDLIRVADSRMYELKKQMKSQIKSQENKNIN